MLSNGASPSISHLTYLLLFVFTISETTFLLSSLRYKPSILARTLSPQSRGFFPEHCCFFWIWLAHPTKVEAEFLWPLLLAGAEDMFNFFFCNYQCIMCLAWVKCIYILTVIIVYIYEERKGIPKARVSRSTQLPYPWTPLDFRTLSWEINRTQSSAALLHGWPLTQNGVFVWPSHKDLRRQSESKVCLHFSLTLSMFN